MSDRDWNVFPGEVRDAIYAGRSISHEKAKTITRCPWSYDCAYRQKLPKVPSKIMVMGGHLDSLLSGQLVIPDPMLTAEDVEMLQARAKAYRPRIKAGAKLQFPVWRRVPDTNPPWWCIGFVDIVHLVGRLVPAPVVDIKFSKEPWKPDKWKYNVQQAKLYLWCLQGMGYDARWFRFDVMNALTDEIQECPQTKKGYYEPEQKSIDGMAAWLREAIGLIESGRKEAVPGGYCRDKHEPPTWQCDWFDNCPGIRLIQGLEEPENDLDLSDL